MGRQNLGETKKRRLSKVNESSAQKKTKRAKKTRQQQSPQYPMLNYQYLQPAVPLLQYSTPIQNAQEWYQKLLIMYTKLMKMRTKTAQNPPVNRSENQSQNSTNSHQTAETITVTSDLQQDGKNDMQWLNEMPTPEEVTYWNDVVLRQGMNELASKDPASAQQHLKEKYEELKEIILTGTTSSGKNAS